MRAALLAFAGMALSGCAMTMSLTSLAFDPDTTASVPTPATMFGTKLDEEDWRRASAALSLAVDPQGSGQPVNWDNPSSKRRGTFAAAGEMKLVNDTICRDFSAQFVESSMFGSPKETRRNGLACRTGPGEWAVRSVEPVGTTTASTGTARPTALSLQPLPAPTSSMLPAKAPPAR